MKKKINIGLIGFGVVGTGLYEVLNQSKLLGASISKIVVKDRYKKRSLPREMFSFDIDDVLNDDTINVVVELINDSEIAYQLVKKAFKQGKNVVSANKKMIAERLDELITLSKQHNVSFLYEGAVGGSIPIIRNLEEYYNNDALSSIQGIVNGTTNYILTQSNEGISYAEALQKATELGFAETNPTLDVDGFDSTYKLVLLIKHAFGLTVNPDTVFHCGIRNITQQDINYAKEKGYRIKLFCRAEKQGKKIVGFVAPHFVEYTNFGYNVNNEFNALIVEALFSDKQLFIGKGAGSYPTASAVLSDISALQFDYQYEYRKTETLQENSFHEDFLLKVYVSSPTIKAINGLPFYRIDEIYQSADYNYQTGWVKLSDISQLKWNNTPNLSLIILPEVVIYEKQNELFTDERTHHLIENHTEK